MKTPILRRLTIFLAAAGLLAACSHLEAEPPAEARKLVKSATETINRFATDQRLRDFTRHIPKARAVAVFPFLIKAGFVAGGEGGNGVLLGHGSDGGWTGPAFLSLGAASFGLQAGVQATEVILVIRSEKALQAVLRNQGSLGADTGITVAVYGAGIEGATTSNLGADIIAFANSKGGLYGGLSLEGAVFIRRRDMNEAVYGAGATPDAILAGQMAMPEADSLKRALSQAR